MESGVDAHQIISINFEDFDYFDLLDAKALYTYIKPKVEVIHREGKRAYIFLMRYNKLMSLSALLIVYILRMISICTLLDPMHVYFRESYLHCFLVDMLKFRCFH